MCGLPRSVSKEFEVTALIATVPTRQALKSGSEIAQVKARRIGCPFDSFLVWALVVVLHGLKASKAVFRAEIGQKGRASSLIIADSIILVLKEKVPRASLLQDLQNGVQNLWRRNWLTHRLCWLSRQ